MRNWFATNKQRLKIASVWALLGAVIGTALALIPAPAPDSPSLTLALTGVLLANLGAIYIVFGGSASSVFSNDFRAGLSFVFSKDTLGSFAGYALLGVIFVALPPIATGGAVSIPLAGVSVISLAVGWLLASTIIKRAFQVAFVAQHGEQEAAQPIVRSERTGMFLVDIRNRVQDFGARATTAVKPKADKLRLSWLYALLILAAPTLLFGWLPFVLDLQTYTIVSSILSFAFFALGAGVWATFFSKKAL